MTLLKLLQDWDGRTDWESVDLETGYFFEQWFVHEDDSLLDVLRETMLPHRHVLSIDDEGVPYVVEAIRWGDIVQAYQRIFNFYSENDYLLRDPQYLETMVGRPRKIEGDDLKQIQKYLEQQTAQRNMKKEEWRKQNEVRELARVVGYDKALEALKKLVEE
jgi:hypothetical protein